MSITLWQRGADELNIASLSLISIQTRLPDDFQDWQETFTLGDRPVMVKATAGKLGLPHGLDVDTNSALINLFLEQGCPDDNSVNITTYGLLQAIGLDDAGSNYTLLNESLHRMLLASFTIEGWFDYNGGMIIGTTLRLIDRIRHVQRSERGEREVFGRPFGKNAMLTITLPEEIAANIRSGHLRGIDRTFMRALNSPLTRGLFRLLDAVSDDTPVFEVGLMDWARRCRLASDVPTRIRRTLEPAHTELIEQAFLKRVEYEGRGKGQVIRYEFRRQRPDFPMTDGQLKLIGHLKQLGVAPPQAEQYVRTHREARVMERIHLAEAVVASSRNIRNQGALVWDVLNNQDGKYAPPTSPAVLLVAPSTTAARPRTEPQEPPVDPWPAEVYEAQTPEERAAATLRFLKVLLSRAAPEALYAQIAAEVRNGRIDGRDLVQEASRAWKSMALQAFVEDVRQLVGRPTGT